MKNDTVLNYVEVPEGLGEARNVRHGFPVAVGDSLYVVLGPHGDHYYDSTQVDFTVSKVK